MATRQIQFQCKRFQCKLLVLKIRFDTFFFSWVQRKQPSFFLMFQPLLFWLVSDYVHNVHPHTDIPDGPRKLAISTLSLANGTSPARSPVNGVAGGQPLSQRKRLLKAPTLAELDSSDSDVSVFYIFSIARNLPKCWTRLLGQSHRSQSELDC